jgi:hypothetical protein
LFPITGLYPATFVKPPSALNSISSCFFSLASSDKVIHSFLAFSSFFLIHSLGGSLPFFTPNSFLKASWFFYCFFNPIFSHYFLPPFLNICVPLIPKILPTTKIQRVLNHVGSAAKCSKKIFTFSIAAWIVTEDSPQRAQLLALK